jgi:hypothetical protein
MAAEGRDKYHARTIAAVVVVLSVLAYTAAVVSGFIGEKNKIDTVNLAIIALGILGTIVLLQPEVLTRLKLFELAGFKLEMLEVKEQQAKQGSHLQDIALVLPLLLPETERAHLLNLANATTASYRGCHPLRAELRRLRSIKLIRMRGDHHVGEIQNNLIFDLARYVELTELGERWAKRIREIEHREGQS